jgi:hypothetical protein
MREERKKRRGRRRGRGEKRPTSPKINHKQIHDVQIENVQNNASNDMTERHF